jgi:hypothetical protein
MEKDSSARMDFWLAVTGIAESGEPGYERDYCQEIHNDLMDKDSRYNSAFIKLQELSQDKKTQAFDNRVEEIYETTKEGSLRQDFLVGVEVVKNFPRAYKLMQYENEIMQSYDRNSPSL